MVKQLTVLELQELAKLEEYNDKPCKRILSGKYCDNSPQCVRCGVKLARLQELSLINNNTSGGGGK